MHASEVSESSMQSATTKIGAGGGTSAQAEMRTAQARNTATALERLIGTDRGESICLVQVRRPWMRSYALGDGGVLVGS